MIYSEWNYISSQPNISNVFYQIFSNMAGTAMNLKYYDTSVDILKAAYDIAPFKPIESNETKTLLDDLKKQVLRIHNSLVTKRKKRVSETHKGN